MNDVLGHAIPSIRFASVQLARIGEGFGLASEVYRVTCTPAATSDPSAPSTPCTFVIKLWSTEGVAGTREVAFYREFGGDPGLRIPRAFHGALDLDRARGVLVLEDIRDATQGDCLDTLDVDRQAAIARMMARFHARWWSDPRLREHSWLPSMRAYDRAPDWYSLRRRQFLERCGEDLRPEIRPWLESAPALISRSHELLADVPDTLLHGDFHLDNVLFPP
ncbi:MAG: aminoglycoside phosphotransferase family protein, partial [Gemmatimonadetes bacterium]|nr:aminoglycoside phosphotransferase family protein [Gemmatimonadota bacterium]